MQAMIDKMAGECVAVRLRMLNRVVTNIYDDALRSLDLKVSQMNILVAAAKMGVARPVDVCEHLQLDVSTLSRNVERMKARGWLGLFAVLSYPSVVFSDLCHMLGESNAELSAIKATDRKQNAA